jgi:hypothetical protein
MPETYYNVLQRKITKGANGLLSAAPFALSNINFVIIPNERSCLFNVWRILRIRNQRHIVCLQQCLHCTRNLLFLRKYQHPLLFCSAPRHRRGRSFSAPRAPGNPAPLQTLPPCLPPSLPLSLPLSLKKSGSPSQFINQPRSSRPKSQATPRGRRTRASLSLSLSLYIYIYIYIQIYIKNEQVL